MVNEPLLFPSGFLFCFLTRAGGVFAIVDELIVDEDVMICALTGLNMFSSGRGTDDRLFIEAVSSFVSFESLRCR